ncbi:MAG: pyridoxamine 5'-phosphate oxidase family protein [Defluviitaleaceae bacterium]|nr:pyridoxamine 5'-phosphate oxidase family protein [Defluviitaleaceae bacterium]
MRRTDREITNRDEIIDILRRADTIRLGINGDPFPYVVPLSFGFEDVGGEITVYIHGAKEGFKHNLLQANNHVCVEASIFHKYTPTPKGGLTTLYESVIARGTAEIIEGDEAVKGLDIICSHCGYHGFEYNTAALNHMLLYKIPLSSVTGKRNPFGSVYKSK